MPSSPEGPGPLTAVVFSVAVLAVSVLVLLHQEHSYENDPQMRARAGLVNAGSDISLMRTANFHQALAAVAAHLKPGGTIRVLSVTPSKVGATLLDASGAETDVIITPGIHVESRATGNRLNDHRGVDPAAIAAGGPQRILADALQRFGLRPAEFERLSLNVASGPNPAGWSASWSQPTDDEGLVAALDGSDLRRPFTPPKGSG